MNEISKGWKTPKFCQNFFQKLQKMNKIDPLGKEIQGCLGLKVVLHTTSQENLHQGSISSNFFGINLLTLFCKLDLFIKMP